MELELKRMEKIRRELGKTRERIRLNANKWIPEPFVLKFCKFHMSV